MNRPALLLLVAVTVVVLDLLVSSSVSAEFTGLHHHHHIHSANKDVSDEVSHRCIHDSHIIPSMQDRPIIVGSETSGREGAALAQAGIRIMLKVDDLSTPGKFCQSASGTVPDYIGGSIACTADTVLSDAQRTELVSKILPAAVQRLTAAIQVETMTANIVPASSTTCGSNGITISSADTTSGIPNADLVIYIAAAPIASVGTIAFASFCQLHGSTMRPTIGKAVFSPKYIKGLFDSDASYRETMITTAMHEILHAMGFSWQFFSNDFFKSGGPRIVGNVTRRGKTVFFISGANAVKAAQDHLNCSTQSDLAELEDQGGSGTSQSHTERRLFFLDVMNGIASPKAVLSSITLGIMHDSGYYFPVYSQAGTLIWGKGVGCTFANDKCVNGGLANGAEFFCFAEGDGCTFDNTSVGSCSLQTHANDIPETYFRYYPGDPKRGGSTGDLMDACPFVRPYSDYECPSTSRAASESERILGYRFGSGSRCVKAPNLIKAGFTAAASAYRCLGVTCHIGNYISMTLSDGSTATCPLTGAAGAAAMPAGWNGAIECPSFRDYCTGVALAAGGTPAPAAPSTSSPTTSATTTVITLLSDLASASTTAAPPTPAPLFRSDPGFVFTISGGLALFRILASPSNAEKLSEALRKDLSAALGVPESAITIQSVVRSDGTSNAALTKATVRATVIPQNMMGVIDGQRLVATVDTVAPAWLANTNALHLGEGSASGVFFESVAPLTNSSNLARDTVCSHGCRLFIVACIIFGTVILAWIGFLGHSIYRFFVPYVEPPPQQPAEPSTSSSPATATAGPRPAGIAPDSKIQEQQQQQQQSQSQGRYSSIRQQQQQQQPDDIAQDVSSPPRSSAAAAAALSEPASLTPSSVISPIAGPAAAGKRSQSGGGAAAATNEPFASPPSSVAETNNIVDNNSGAIASRNINNNAAAPVTVKAQPTKSSFYNPAGQVPASSIAPAVPAATAANFRVKMPPPAVPARPTGAAVSRPQQQRQQQQQAGDRESVPAGLIPSPTTTTTGHSQ